MHPLGPVDMLDDCASAMVFLTCDKSIWIASSSLFIDTGTIRQ
jgi:hypothetical protein